MNIYDFFHSPDIAKHCQDINHQFSPWDMATIVHLSDKTVVQKHDAYREITAQFSDQTFPGRINFGAKNSLHNYLNELIAYETRVIADIIKPESGAVFQATVSRLWFSAEHPHTDDIDGCYTTFEKAVAAVHEAYDWIEDKLVGATIRKITIDCTDEVLHSVDVNMHGEVTDFTRSGEHAPDYPSELFFHLPLPFERGDLVSDHTGKAYVLDWVPHWLDDGRRNYEAYLSGACGDGSDMLSIVYSYEDGELFRDHGPMLWDLCKYQGELKGIERFLKTLSQYIKSKDDALDWLIAAHSKYHAEARSEKLSAPFGEWYRPLEGE